MFKIILIFLLISCNVYAGDLRNPPPTETAIFDYLNHIRDNHNNLRVTTTDPDGTTPGKVGDIILFNNSGTFSLQVCTDAQSKIWKEVALS